jgi:hypothetical protein
MWIEPILQKYMAKELSFHFAYCASNKRSPFVVEPHFLKFDAEVEFHSPINFEHI